MSFFAKSKSASSYVTVPVYDSEAAVKANKVWWGSSRKGLAGA